MIDEIVVVEYGCVACGGDGKPHAGWDRGKTICSSCTGTGKVRRTVRRLELPYLDLEAYGGRVVGVGQRATQRVTERGE